MGLDVYSVRDKKMENCLITLSNSDVRLLEREISLLKEKTGVYIDPYGTTKVYPDHCKILLEAILRNKKEGGNIINFIGVIKESIKQEDVLVFEGD